MNNTSNGRIVATPRGEQGSKVPDASVGATLLAGWFTRQAAPVRARRSTSSVKKLMWRHVGSGIGE